MPIRTGGKGSGFEWYWRNQTQFGVVNLGDVDFAPGGVFEKYAERRADIGKVNAKCELSTTWGVAPAVLTKESGWKTDDVLPGFQAFHIGPTRPRIAPQGMWHDQAGSLHGLKDNGAVKRMTWIAWPMTPEANAEIEALIKQREELLEHYFHAVWYDFRHGVKVERQGFWDARAFLRDVSDAHQDIAAGVIDAFTVKETAQKAARLESVVAEKDNAIAELQAKIAEYQAKAGEAAGIGVGTGPAAPKHVATETPESLMAGTPSRKPASRQSA